MSKISKNITIYQYQKFIQKIYGLPNSRHFSSWDMLSNMERFIMRGLKGIRKRDNRKAKLNLTISLSWFVSLLNQLHINLEVETWRRFPFACSYCGTSPCLCKNKKIKKRKFFQKTDNEKPLTLHGFQEMFEKIYPSSERNLEHAGIHLAEEMGEISEALLSYRGSHKEKEFDKLKLEAADLFSCFLGVFNSLKVDIANELSRLFKNNCHVCHKDPCVCDFSQIVKFKF